MEEKIKEIEKGKNYLIENTIGLSRIIQKIKVLDVTNRCYYIQFGEKENCIWVYKSDFEPQRYNSPKYIIIEYL